MNINSALQAHLKLGTTQVCRCWSVVRQDGAVYGFTDHDQALEFENIKFKANTGLTAKALQQTTGLAVDNSEALGALSDASVSEEDILAGRFDGAEVHSWLVNWADPDMRQLQFRGSFGEIRQTAGAFQAELRGLTESLNQPQGQVFQKPCSAVLGDGRCTFDLTGPGYVAELAAETVHHRRDFQFETLTGFAENWFARGRLEILTGAAAGLVGVIKTDRIVGAGRHITLWEEVRAPVAAGDVLRLEPGCDKRPETCKEKFNNFVNFRGFPDIPGEDWLLSYPVEGGLNDGRSRTS